jgi:OTU domain-containing protein 6
MILIFEIVLFFSVEAEFETKQKEMKARHEDELKAVSGGGGAEEEVGVGIDNNNNNSSIGNENDDKEKSSASALTPAQVAATAEEERQRLIREKLGLKKEKEREKAREKERAKEQAIVDENANAGPAPRDVEMQIIQSKLPVGMQMEEVTADGHCLYRAVAAHSEFSYSHIRNLCADKLQEHEADFAPFCEYTDVIPDYVTYVNRVRSSADWGGHLELRALSMALHRPVIVYSAQSLKPLVIAEEVSQQGDAAHDNPIRLSYHLSYYSLGEHYNRVVVGVQD